MLHLALCAFRMPPIFHCTLLGAGKIACGLLLFVYSLPLTFQSAYDPSDLLASELTTDAHLVVRSSETIFRIENETDAVLERHWVVTILKPEGNYAATAVCTEDVFTKVRKMEGRLYDGAGNLLRESDKKEVRDYGNGAEYAFTDHRTKVLTMQNSTLPYTVEFKTRETIRGFFRSPEFEVQRLREAVLQASYTIVAPAAYRLKWKSIHVDIEPEVRTTGDETTWTWTAAKLAAKPVETNHACFANQYAEVLFAPEKVKIDQYTGDLSTWTEAGRFFYTLNRDRDNLPADVQTLVRSLTAQARNNREKIDILYRYLQANQRYVSILAAGKPSTQPL